MTSGCTAFLTAVEKRAAAAVFPGQRALRAELPG